MESSIKSVKSDVLVVGGGLAGCFSALSARDEDVDVVVLEKADIRRSGCAGPGLDEAQLVDPEITISAAEFYESVLKRFGEMGDPSLLKLFSGWMLESKQRLLELEKYGVNVLKDGEFRLNKRKHSHEIWFDGRNLKPCLAAEVVRRGIRVFNHTMAVGLLKNGGKVVGALALNIRDGGLTAFAAPATVITTGVPTRLYGPPDVGPFLNDYCPACCGDGHAMAYDAGAMIAGMEFARVKIRPVKEWLCRVMQSAGAALYTAEGEYLYQSGGTSAASVHEDMYSLGKVGRNVMCEALSLQQHGKQLFWDATGLSEREYEGMRFSMENEKPISQKFSRDAGFDFRKHPMEAHLVPWNFRSGLAGVVVDGELRTSLEGLYAVGDVVGGTGIRLGGMMCSVYANHLGEIVARCAKNEQPERPDSGQMEVLASAAVAPLEVRDGYNPLEVERAVQHIVATYAGLLRSGPKLAWGLGELERVQKELLPNLSASTPHELMRAFEARCLATVAEMHLRASLFRTETRLPPMHYRTDYPMQDDVNWKGTIVAIQKQNDKMVLSKIRRDGI